MNDFVWVFAVLGVLVISAWTMIWVQPKSAEYVAELLWRRACALTAGRAAYRKAWVDEHLDDNVADFGKRLAQHVRARNIGVQSIVAGQAVFGGVVEPVAYPGGIDPASIAWSEALAESNKLGAEGKL